MKTTTPIKNKNGITIRKISTEYNINVLNFYIAEQLHKLKQNSIILYTNINVYFGIDTERS